MPVINTAYIAFMMGNIIQEKPEVCVTANGKFIEPLNAFYSRPLIPLISSLLGSGFKSLHHLFRSCHTLTIPEFQARSFDGCFEMFTNLNTREDLARFASSGVNHKNRDSQVVERMVGFMPKNLVAA
jgi:molybdopterin-guanine dinucleotide biosynthesis protein A